MGAGCIEYVAANFHTYAGTRAHSKRTFVLAALVEVMVIVAITVMLTTEMRHASFFIMLPHLVSVTQSVVVMSSNALWLFWIGPRWFPHMTLEHKVASLIVGNVNRFGAVFRDQSMEHQPQLVGDVLVAGHSGHDKAATAGD